MRSAAARGAQARAAVRTLLLSSPAAGEERQPRPQDKSVGRRGAPVAAAVAGEERTPQKRSASRGRGDGNAEERRHGVPWTEDEHRYAM